MISIGGGWWYKLFAFLRFFNTFFDGIEISENKIGEFLLFFPVSENVVSFSKLSVF